MATICFDIDGTLTDDRGPPQIDQRFALGNALMEIFCVAVQEIHGGTRENVVDQLTTYAERKVYWDYPDFISHFDLPAASVWEQLRAWHRENIHAYEDGVQLVRALHNAGHQLHIISNNPYTGCLLKLEVAGLGSLDGTPWFQHIFCANQQRGQKGAVSFWQRAVERGALHPPSTCVIGNDLHDDYEVPSKLGFGAHFIVDRDRSFAGVRQDERLIIVRSLLEVLDHPVIGDHVPEHASL